MQDPHIETLRYEVYSGSGIAYEKPQPVTLTNLLGNFKLADGRLVINPAEHYSDPEQAREIIEPFLRAWEIEADLRGNHKTIRFKFLRAEIVDRALDSKNKTTPHSFSVTGTTHITIIPRSTMQLILNSYPSPPVTFRSTPEAAVAFNRWMQFREGKEPLQSMAYFVLTVLENNAGGRKNAAKIYRIDNKFLKEFGRLSSTKGTPANARKFQFGGNMVQLTDQEQHWLDAATRLIIRRLGEHASGADLDQITLDDPSFLNPKK